MKNELCNAIEHALEEVSQLVNLQKQLRKLKLRQSPYLLAIGKSAYPMAKVCCRILKEKGIEAQGFLLGKYGMSGQPIPGICSLEAGHPSPDANSIKHSIRIMEWLQGLSEDRTLIILLSGGASSLFEIPTSGLDLADLIELNKKLLASGLPIKEMNLIRSQHSKVKAGKALALIPCRQIHAFAVSDVEGNDPRVIGSGSFFPETALPHRGSSFTATLAGCRNYSYHIVADNLMLRKVLKKALPAPVTNHQGFINLRAEDFAKLLGREALLMRTSTTRLFGGETTIEVKGNGLGGRCSHLALLVANQISGLPGISFMAVASDGNDNLEGCSGAYVDGSTWQSMIDNGIDPNLAIAAFDSHSALSAVSAIIPSWQHPVNINDLYILTSSK